MEAVVVYIYHQTGVAQPVCWSKNAFSHVFPFSVIILKQKLVQKHKKGIKILPTNAGSYQSFGVAF